ncbi:hypothetical protein [Streptomyces sp. NPDC005732]|uniref:hypothetical protein n=1 Tax=Streptomyces sp. NPDC005732 TaxID=3157057 RepID=UPI0033CD4DFE
MTRHRKITGPERRPLFVVYPPSKGVVAAVFSGLAEAAYAYGWIPGGPTAGAAFATIAAGALVTDCVERGK